MRKRLLSNEEHWLDLEPLAEVVLSSEDPAYPIESALTESATGWRAATPGKQIIRICFDQTQALQSILLVFTVTENRCQEYCLRWSADGLAYHDILRQQWYFSQQASIEREEHQLNLAAVKVLELSITPDVNNTLAIASLSLLRLA